MPVHTRFAAPVTVALRAPDQVQVGLDSARSLVLRDAPPDADRAVRAFTTWCTPARAATAAPGIDRAWLDDALATLARAGLLEQTQHPTRAVTVLGSGPLAHACARVLAGANLAVWRPEGERVEACRPGLPVIVASSQIEPDRALLHRLLEAELTHVIVRAEPERTVVGPFVVPGRTSCTRCLDLVRRDHDRRWPYLLTQLCRLTAHPDAGATAWAAATVTAQLRAWFATGTPDTLGATIELETETWTLGARRWPVHPHCGCAAA